MNMRTRLTAAALLAATAFGLAAAPGAPAGADEIPVPSGKAASKTFSYSGFNGDTPYNTEDFTAPGTTPIVGNFAGNQADEILWYTPGAGGDALYTNNGNFEFSQSAQTISGTYAPKVGTFATGDGYEDVLWYSTTGPSQLWDFNGDGTITKASLPAVTGPGRIIVGDFALDGIDDVIRYQAGSASDSWWDFQTMGQVSRPLNVNGSYTPIVGTFGTDAYDDILWYAHGPTQDFLWDFIGGGGKTTWDLAINGTFQPVVARFTDDGRDDILWYAPGQAADSVWNFDGAGYVKKSVTINGSYQAVAGNFLTGSSIWQDVMFFGAGGAGDSAWKTTSNQPTFASKATSIFGSSVVAVGSFYAGSTRAIAIIRH
jgi:hypothetical protein